MSAPDEELVCVAPSLDTVRDTFGPALLSTPFPDQLKGIRIITTPFAQGLQLVPVSWLQRPVNLSPPPRYPNPFAALFALYQLQKSIGGEFPPTVSLDRIGEPSA